MPADPAFAAPPRTPSADTPGVGEPDFDAIHAAVVATAQGRWFLDQYASRNRREAEVGQGGDIARLVRDLGELGDTLMRARADIAAIEPPGGASPHASILAATEALQELAWFMRERGLEPLYCDRIAGCVRDIRAACAIPDLTAQRIGAIAGMLGDLEDRLHAIGAGLGDVVRDGDQFGDFRAFLAANANSPPAATAVAIEEEFVDADLAVVTPDLAAGIEPPASSAAVDPTGTHSSPRLTHLLMVAEFDRLLDARAAKTRASARPAPVEVVPPQAPCAETTEAGQASPAVPQPRRAAEIAKDLFADVMALSEAERIALFT
jgi:hypothetical protein